VHFHPVVVVRSVRGVVSVGFEASEVFEPHALWIQERLVDSKVVRIAVDINYRLSESGDLVAQGEQDFLKAVSYSSREGKGIRIADRLALDWVVVETGVSLRNQHYGSRIVILGILEGLSHPRNNGVAPVSPLDGVGGVLAKVVARALDVQCGERDAVVGPAAIFNAGNQPSTRAKADSICLYLLPKLVLAQCEWRFEEELPLVVKPLERIERSIFGGVA